MSNLRAEVFLGIAEEISNKNTQLASAFIHNCKGYKDFNLHLLFVKHIMTNGKLSSLKKNELIMALCFLAEITKEYKVREVVTPDSLMFPRVIQMVPNGK